MNVHKNNYPIQQILQIDKKKQLGTKRDVMFKIDIEEILKNYLIQFVKLQCKQYINLFKQLFSDNCLNHFRENWDQKKH